MKIIIGAMMLGFYVTGGIYHVWTIIIAFKHSMLAGLLTVIFPVISNIYWLFKMSNNTMYMRFAIATLILGILYTFFNKVFNDQVY